MPHVTLDQIVGVGDAALRRIRSVKDAVAVFVGDDGAPLQQRVQLARGGGSGAVDQRVEKQIPLWRQRGGVGGGRRGGGTVGEQRDAGVQIGDQLGREMRLQRPEVRRQFRFQITARTGRIETDF